MALQLKILRATNSLPNPGSAAIYPPSGAIAGKMAITKCILITNRNTAIATVNLTVKQNNDSLKEGQLTPVDLQIPPKSQVVIESEIALDLNAADTIYGRSSVAGVDCVISGIERDI